MDEDPPSYRLAYAADGTLVAAASRSVCEDDGTDLDLALLGAIAARPQALSHGTLAIFDADLLDDDGTDGEGRPAASVDWNRRAEGLGLEMLAILDTPADHERMPLPMCELPGADGDAVWGAMGKRIGEIEVAVALADPVRRLLAALAHERLPAKADGDAVVTAVRVGPEARITRFPSGYVIADGAGRVLADGVADEREAAAVAARAWREWQAAEAARSFREAIRSLWPGKAGRPMK